MKIQSKIIVLIGLICIIPSMILGAGKGAWNGLMFIYYQLIIQKPGKWEEYFLRSERGFNIPMSSKLYEKYLKK